MTFSVWCMCLCVCVCVVCICMCVCRVCVCECVISSFLSHLVIIQAHTTQLVKRIIEALLLGFECDMALERPLTILLSGERGDMFKV